jgi:hypothetical protein
MPEVASLKLEATAFIALSSSVPTFGPMYVLGAGDEAPRGAAAADLAREDSSVISQITRLSGSGQGRL